MVEKITEMYSKTYCLYISIKSSLEFFCIFLIQDQIYKDLLEHIGNFFHRLCQGIKQSDFLSNQIYGAGTACHFVFNAVDLMPGISIQYK